jgi:hypothetical protein
MSEVLRLIRQKHPNENVLGSGVAKCRSLDSKIFDEHLTGRGTSGGLGVLEADWVATNVALYYVTPRVGSVLRWLWSDIASIEKGRRKLVTADTQIRLADGTSMKWNLAATSSAKLCEIARDGIAIYSRSPVTTPLTGNRDSEIKALFTESEWQQIRGIPSAAMMMVVMADNNAEDGEMAATIREVLGGVDNYKSQLAKAMSIEQARDVLAQRDTPVSSITLTAAFSMIRSRVEPAEYLAFVVDLTDSVFAVASQYGLSPRLSDREKQEFREGMTTAFLNECGVDPREWVKASRWM